MLQLLPIPLAQTKGAESSQVFCPKDKLAEWFEFYANVLELNIWTKTTVTASQWNDENQKWTIQVDREKEGKKTTRDVEPFCLVRVDI